MAKPTDDLTWASAGVYDAGAQPYSGQSSVTAPLAGRQRQGHEPGKKPGAQTMNWWQRAVWRWIGWLSALFDDNGNFNGDMVRHDHIAPSIMWGSNFIVDDQLVGGDGHANPAIVSTANGGCMVDLKVPYGFRLVSVTVKATGASGTGLTISVVAPVTATGIERTCHSITGPTVGPTDTTLNTDASLAAATPITVGGNTATITYTRTTGSWITDGFEVGQRFATVGFVNGANNRDGVTQFQEVTAVTALGLSVQWDGVTAPVVETTTPTSIKIVATQKDDTQYVALLLNSVGSNGAGIRAIRTTYKKNV